MATINTIEAIEQSGLDRRQKLLILAGLLYYSLIGLVGIAYVVTSLGMLQGLVSGSLGEASSSLSTAQRLGMVAGPVGMGILADRVGRRPALLASLGLMVLGLLLSITAQSIAQAFIGRLVNAAGSGGLAVTATVLVAENINLRLRAFSIVLVGIGTVLGTMPGGLVMALLLNREDPPWQLALGICLFLVILVTGLSWKFLDETPYFHHEKAINKVSDTNSPAYDRQGVMLRHWHLLAGYVLHAAAYYVFLRGVFFNLNFAPTGTGLGMSLTWITVGGLAANSVLVLLLLKVNVEKVVLPALLVSGLLFLLTGINPETLARVGINLFSIVFFCNMGLAGLNAIVVINMPTRVRATALGLMTLFGQLAVMTAPWAAASIMDHALGYFGIWYLLGAGSLVAARFLFGVIKNSANGISTQ